MCSSLTLNDNVTEEIYGTMNLKDDGRDKGSYCTIDSNQYHLFQSKVVGIYTDTISNGLPCENNHVNATFAV